MRCREELLTRTAIVCSRRGRCLAECPDESPENPTSIRFSELRSQSILGLRSSTTRLPKGRAFFRKESARSASR